MDPLNQLSSNIGEDTIGSATSVEAVVAALAKRGCRDLTLSIDLATCSDIPCANGGFCDVYRAKLGDGTQVAIKSLRIYGGAEADMQRKKILKNAAWELYHWSKLRHCNVLPLLGLALFRGQLSMVSEWMDNGNVISFLRSNPDVNRILLCMNICAGLCYIHENEMVHGDLKAANVMVSPRGVAMISDFGCARLKDLTLKFPETPTTSFSVRWAAPELLCQDHGSQRSKAVDVYAYGMTALEVLTGKIPFEGVQEHRVIGLIAMERQHPPRPDMDIDDQLWELLVACWAADPAQRPSTTGVRDRLHAIYNQVLPAELNPSDDSAIGSPGGNEQPCSQQSAWTSVAVIKQIARNNLTSASMLLASDPAPAHNAPDPHMLLQQNPPDISAVQAQSVAPARVPMLSWLRWRRTYSTSSQVHMPVSLFAEVERPTHSPLQLYSPAPPLHQHLDPSSVDVASGSTRSPVSPGTPPSLARDYLMNHVQPKYKKKSQVRPGERLAVLLPKSLWKPDIWASECDSWQCTTKFTIFERRHHCRKCGGVFCQACSAKRTLLLDTTNLPFFYPPSDITLTDHPLGPMVDSRVCDDCYCLIYGIAPKTSIMERSSDLDVTERPRSRSSSSSIVSFSSRRAHGRTTRNLSTEHISVHHNSIRRPRSFASE